MTKVKEIKTTAYFKRFQVKNRRRRECKTDYRARRALIIQAKNKFNAPKYRVIVRRTNQFYIVQIATTDSKGDKILATANSWELQKYGLKFGLKNFSAVYCTGLLCGRRLLTKLNITKIFKGQSNNDIGKPFEKDPKIERRPFKAVLDVGLARTTIGSRIFSALKGICDSGIEVPHSDTRFFGYDAKKKQLDSKKLRNRILGGHIASYMQKLENEDSTKYQKQFSEMIKLGINHAKVSEIYSNTIQLIKDNPFLNSTINPKVAPSDSILNRKQKRALFKEAHPNLVQKHAPIKRTTRTERREKANLRKNDFIKSLQEMAATKDAVSSSQEASDDEEESDE